MRWWPEQQERGFSSQAAIRQHRDFVPALNAHASHAMEPSILLNECYAACSWCFPASRGFVIGWKRHQRRIG
jgi:hypothetical protein